MQPPIGHSEQEGAPILSHKRFCVLKFSSFLIFTPLPDGRISQYLQTFKARSFRCTLSARSLSSAIQHSRLGFFSFFLFFFRCSGQNIDPRVGSGRVRVVCQRREDPVVACCGIPLRLHLTCQRTRRAGTGYSRNPASAPSPGLLSWVGSLPQSELGSCLVPCRGASPLWVKRRLLGFIPAPAAAHLSVTSIWFPCCPQVPVAAIIPCLDGQACAFQRFVSSACHQRRRSACIRARAVQTGPGRPNDERQERERERRELAEARDRPSLQGPSTRPGSAPRIVVHCVWDEREALSWSWRHPVLPPAARVP